MARRKRATRVPRRRCGCWLRPRSAPRASTLPRLALPREAAAAVHRRASNDLTASGPLRFIVDPHGFRVGDTELAAGQSQVVALAESLHALQVGQLVIAPGRDRAETAAFVAVANTDPRRSGPAGGPRAASSAAASPHRRHRGLAPRIRGGGASRRRSDDRAARRDRRRGRHGRRAPSRGSAATGPADDEVADAISRLEDATRELAMERVAAALMRLDETTRMRVLAHLAQGRHQRRAAWRACSASSRA